MTNEEMEKQAVTTIREIATMTALHTAGPNGGATVIAILITAYSEAIGELLIHDFISLEEAIRCTSADLDVVQDAMREIAAIKEKRL
jgi:L-cystine uptake protein TcyP (sodium:dicarboxylate symporter family)